MADAGSAAFRVSGMELGGLFGSLLAGRISDALIAKNPKGGNVGKRVQASSILMNDFPCPLTVVDRHMLAFLSMHAHWLREQASLNISAPLMIFACHACLSLCRL